MFLYTYEHFCYIFPQNWGTAYKVEACLPLSEDEPRETRGDRPALQTVRQGGAGYKPGRQESVGTGGYAASHQPLAPDQRQRRC